MSDILRWSKKTCLLFFNVFVIVCSVKGQLYGDYPYREKFDKTTKPADISIPVPGNSSYTNKATFTAEGVRLTEAKTSQFGAIFVNNRQFSAVNGVHIEFEYSMYGGTGGGADGLSFFLFDASITSPSIGAVGAGIGYSYNRATDNYTNDRNKGLSGAYLGIALDSYGNFKGRRFQGNSLVNGIVWSNYNSSINGSNHVTLRGAKGAAINSSTNWWDSDNTVGLSDGYTGYPVLITQTTSGSSATNRNGVVLNDDGSYSTISSYTGNFNLRNGAYTVDPSNSNYRKAIITLYPHASGGFLVTVKIQHGTDISTVIDNYHYKTSFTYTENAIVYRGDNMGSTSNSPISYTYLMKAPVPQFLRFGFAASTGDYTDYHYIRMVEVTLPGSAKANEDTAQTYSGVSTAINALANDLAYTGIVAQNQVGSSTYINKSTFKFLDENNVPSTTPYEYTKSGVGTWKYDASTGLVTFTPLTTFVGTATINYTIKGGNNNELPYYDESYRSFPASITVTVQKPINTHIVTNRFIQPVFK